MVKTIALATGLFAYSVLKAQYDYNLLTDQIYIRDPFIYADTATNLYYMYSSLHSQKDKKGVEVFISKDLKIWTEPKIVLDLPADCWGLNAVWAPEMFRYKDRYYIFTTITSDSKIKTKPAFAIDSTWPKFYKRGTQIFYANSPLGPFRPFANKSHTPEEWMALDGTLFIENDMPYMVFCHEWVQIKDGSIDVMPLSPGLDSAAGKSSIIFNASYAEWVDKSHPGLVTDGPFIHKTKSGKLVMIWSSFGKAGYAVGMAISKSGKIHGPWKQSRNLLFKENGGHGMIFRTFDDKLMLALHQPNHPAGKERLKLFEIIEKNDELALK